MSKNKSKIILSVIMVVAICLSATLGYFANDWINGTSTDLQNTTEVEVGTVKGKVLTDSGEMIGCGIIIEDDKGNTYRQNSNMLSGFDLKLKPGNYKFHFTRGIEFSIETKDVVVESHKITDVPDVRLIELYDSYGKGWVAGDLHQHTNYSDGSNWVDEVLFSNINNGLYYGFLSDHNSAVGLSQWLQGNRFASNFDSDGNVVNFNPFMAVEVTTEFGHYQSLGVGMTFDKYETVLREEERSLPEAQRIEIIKERIIYIANEIRRAGGVPQINHPFSSSTMGFEKYWDVADYFDTIEIWNGVFVPGDGRFEKPTSLEQNYKSKMKWFELLNKVKDGGKFFAGTGGTDNHEVESDYSNVREINDIKNMEDYKTAHAKKGLYSGQPTTYLHLPNKDGALSQEEVLEAIRSGNSFITNGPIPLANIDGASYGNTAKIKDGKAKLNLETFCRDGIDTIKIVKNGETIKEIQVGSTEFYETIELDNLTSGDWLVIEVLGTGVNYAITNPIFIG